MTAYSTQLPSLTKEKLAEVKTALLLQGYTVVVTDAWASKDHRHIVANAPPGCFLKKYKIPTVTNFQDEDAAWTWLAEDAGLI